MEDKTKTKLAMTKGGIHLSVVNRRKVTISPNNPLVQVPSGVEVDPTVPEWIKERASPAFYWSEITDRPEDLGNMELENLINQMGGL